jgi:hypothetical protein
LKGYQLGVDDFVSKPYRTVELRARVDRLTARLRPRSEASLRGELEKVSLASVLTFLELERKSGELVVEGDQIARLQIRDGRPLRIDIEDAPPTPQLEMVYALLDWPRGHFHFTHRDVESSDDIGTSSTALLLEHARMKDESNQRG